jgi:putative DNA primase/helicase
MNQLPSIEDDTHGMWRRINVIEFPRTFSETEMDVGLTEKLVSELSGIFNWALEGYKRLRNQKFIFSESKSMQKTKLQYQTDSNSSLDFSLNYLKEADSENSLAFKDVHDCFIKFCEKEGHKKPYPKKQYFISR